MASLLTAYSVEWCGNSRMVKVEGRIMQISRLNWTYYSELCLDWTEENTEKDSQCSWNVGRDLNPRLSQHEAVVLTMWPRHSVTLFKIQFFRNNKITTTTTTTITIKPTIFTLFFTDMKFCLLY